MKVLAPVMAIVLGGCAALRPTTGMVMADRPGYTDTPTVLPARGFELEAGVTADRVDEVTYSSIGEVLLRAGVGKRIELRFFANSFGIRSAPGEATSHGGEDSKFGAKFALHTAPDSVHTVVPRVSLLVATTLATGADNRTAHEAQPEAKLAAAWTTAGKWSLYTNVGIGHVYDGASWGTHGWVSAALWYAASSKVSVFGEGMTVQHISGTATKANYVDAGVTYLFSDHLQADVRIGHGVGDPTSHEKFAGVGAAYRW